MRLLHGSSLKVDSGQVLRGRGEAYIRDWSNCDFYQALERHRPSKMIAHHDAVFMCASVEDVDLAGGVQDFILVIEPVGAVTRHDVNWSSRISCLMGDGHEINGPEVAQAAAAYWAGTPAPDEQVWEYLCREARVVFCFPEDAIVEGLVNPDLLISSQSATLALSGRTRNPNTPTPESIHP